MQILPVCQVSVGKARVDEHLIGFVSEAFQQTMGHAECPVLGVIGRSIGDQVGLIGQRIDVLLELSQ